MVRALHHEQRLDGSDIKVRFNGTLALYWGTRTYTSDNGCSAPAPGTATGTVNTAGGPLTVRSGPGTSVTGAYGTSTIWDRIGTGRQLSRHIFPTTARILTPPRGARIYHLHVREWVVLESPRMTGGSRTMALAFSLLGPVTLHVNGVRVALPTGRPQLLLAALLVGRGKRVSTDRLLTGLWDSPPPSAPVNLRTYATRLRTALGPHRDRLTWVNNGYALSLQPGELDLEKFDDDVRHALDARRGGNPVQSADLLSVALRRWQGEAAEGLPRYGMLGGSLAALDESRWVTVERYAAACVEVGRHAAAVTALRTLVSDQPARESAWEALVRALVQSGDRADALAALSAADTALRSKANRGLGRVLREFERELLEGPPAPQRRRSPAHRVNPPGHTPSKLPPSTLPPPVVLVGREHLLARVGATLGSTGTIVLHGPAGVGKSALARTVASRLAHAFPGGQLYLDFYGSSPGLTPMTVEEAVSGLLRMLGGASSGSTAGREATELRALLSTRRVLVVLDNVVEAAQVRRLLSVLGNAATIVTSRAALPTLDVTHFAVGELDAYDSVRLLARHVGADRIDRSSQDAETLAAMCGHLPLALRIVGARLSSHPEWTLADMVTRLSDEQHRLDELSCDDLAVRASLAVTCDILAERTGGHEALELFSRWGSVHLPTLGVELARVLTGASTRQARTLLDRLAEAGLIEACGVDRYRMHDLVRIYAMERGRRDPEGRTAAIHASRCYFLATARRARDQIRPVTDRAPDGFVEAYPTVTFTAQGDALRWLEAERENLVAAARTAARDETPEGSEFAVRLCTELYPFLPMRGYYHDFREVAECALRCARRLGSRPDESLSLTYFAMAQSRLGDIDQAVDNLRVALDLSKADGDTQTTAVAFDRLGLMLIVASRFEEAETAYLQALDIHRERDDRQRMGITLNNLADVLLHLGQPEAALVHLRESLRLREESGDTFGLAITILTIGQAYARGGRYRQAYTWLEKALTAIRATGNREAEWRVLIVRAEVHRTTGRLDAARDGLHLALALSQEIGDVSGAQEVRRTLAELDDGRRSVSSR
ncbi:AfsR/SARP family transcriptional regulator [Micromonospora sp. DT31]|uniref:AfsR/SARP family transcriptional regulator n=1 Tax=Micromonospora sp. DT31 TaxID=3393434 RepID=UPI003CF8BFD4